jgi:PAS domain S-box-containing protein
MSTAERWLADGEQFGGEQHLAQQRRRIRRGCLIAAAAWVLAVVVLTSWSSARRVNDQLDDATAGAAGEARNTVQMVDRMFVEMASFAKIVARQTAVHELIDGYNRDARPLLKMPTEQRRDLFRADPKVRELGSFFDAIGKDLGYSRVFLLNLVGINVVANDWRSEATIMGIGFADRGYFGEAMRTGSGQLYAAGRTTSVPGFFFASRVDEGGAPIGVVVVKQDAAATAPLLAGKDLKMIVDADGMVVGASQTAYVMHHVGPLASRQPDVETLRNVFKLDRLEPLALVRPAQAMREGHWLLDGRPVLIMQSALADAHYHLVTVSPLDWVEPMVRTHYVIGGLVALLGLVLAALADRQLAQLAQQRHTELRLSAQLSLFLQSMIDRLPNPIFYKTPDLRFLGCNKAYEETFGIAREQMLGKRITELALMPPEQREHFEAEQRSVLTDASTATREVVLTFADGAAHTVLYSVSPFPLPDGSPGGLVGVLVDVTALKRTQAQLSEAKDAAESASRAKSEFLANMSHEIRTPMNAVLGMSHLALQSGLNPKQHNYVMKVERSARSLLGIINDILDFSKIEAGHLDMESLPFDLGEVMDKLADLVGLQAEEKGIELLFVLPPDLPRRLVGDPMRLGQVLINLCNNAVKFTERGEVILEVGVAAVDTEPDAGSEPGDVVLNFIVTDTGVGMSASQCERLFRPFEQADSSISRRYGGTGLGLAISRHLVERMGGEIGATSRPGEGSRFAFSARFGLQAAGAPSAASDSDAALGLDGVRLLVVDDNATARQILGTMARWFGMETQEVADGWDALRAVSAAERADRPFDLVLVDWKMPGMDGVECARRLCEGEHGRRPAVLMTTAFGREEVMQRVQAAQVPVRDVLVKPVTPSSLLDACRLALGRPGRTERRAQQPNEWLAAHRERLAGARILLVEDNPINQELALELLGDVGLDVTLAGDGRAALEELAQRDFDGVLMDCQMPVMDGYAATREIRADPRWQRLPIIAMTANAMAGDRELALAAGMNDHIAKPIEVRAMFETIARWVQPPR